MTIINKKYVEKKSGRNRIYKKLILYLKCDECAREFVCPENSKSRSKSQISHFCSKNCTVKSIAFGAIRLKREDVMLKKYGSKSFVVTDEFKEKFTKNCIEKYGVKSHLEVPYIREKIKQTCLAKYGKETFAGTDAHKSKLDYHDIAKKAWITKLKNGKMKNISSKQEEGLFKILCHYFGVEDIQRGKELLGQFVDFYIKSLKKYVQMDGVYWHGLNRNEEEIKRFKTRQDKKIYKQILRDRKLNIYCKANNIALVRITDIEFNNMSEDEVLTIIKRS